MKKHAIALTLLIAWGFTGAWATAADTTEPAKIIQAKLTEVTEILNNQNLDQPKKKAMIITSVKPLFDLPLMAKLTLGKRHWATMSEAKRKKFISLFSAHLENAYIGKVDLYSNDEIEFKNPVTKGDKVYVPTELKSTGRMVSINWKFYQANSGWKIYDAEINGTSVILSHRTEYDTVLRRGSIDDLLAKLEQSLQ